jgi:hypothetical protein
MTLAFNTLFIGTCTATINSHDAAGDIFHDVSTLTVVP